MINSSIYRRSWGSGYGHYGICMHQVFQCADQGIGVEQDG